MNDTAYAQELLQSEYDKIITTLGTLLVNGTDADGLNEGFVETVRQEALSLQSALTLLRDADSPFATEEFTASVLGTDEAIQDEWEDTHSETASSAPAPSEPVSDTVIRQWAREHGVNVTNRGRVSAKVKELYFASLGAGA